MAFAPLNRPDGGDLLHDTVSPREFIWFSEEVTQVTPEGLPQQVTSVGTDQAGETVTMVQTITYDAEGRPIQTVTAITDTYGSPTWTKTETIDWSGAFPKVTVS